MLCSSPIVEAIARYDQCKWDFVAGIGQLLKKMSGMGLLHEVSSQQDQCTSKKTFEKAWSTFDRIGAEYLIRLPLYNVRTAEQAE